MPITAGVVKSIVLKMIGGIPINGVPTTTALGMPVTTELSLGGLVGMATSIVSTASAVVGAASALTSIAQNPVGALTDAVSSKLGDLCKEQFSGLDSTLSDLKTLADSNPQINAAYTNLKNAMGGGDGTSGALAKLQKFKNHTDRLSGQVMSIDSNLG